MYVVHDPTSPLANAPPPPCVFSRTSMMDGDICFSLLGINMRSANSWTCWRETVLACTYIRTCARPSDICRNAARKLRWNPFPPPEFILTVPSFFDSSHLRCDIESWLPKSTVLSWEVPIYIHRYKGLLFTMRRWAVTCHGRGCASTTMSSQRRALGNQQTGWLVRFATPCQCSATLYCVSYVTVHV